MAGQPNKEIYRSANEVSDIFNVSLKGRDMDCKATRSLKNLCAVNVVLEMHVINIMFSFLYISL